MHKFIFSTEFNNEKERFWTLTKIADPKGGGVTMRSALNLDPWSIPAVPTTTSSLDPETGVTTTTSSSELENGGAFPTTPDPVVRSHVLYSPELQTYEPILTKSDKTVNYL